MIEQGRDHIRYIDRIVRVEVNQDKHSILQTFIDDFQANGQTRAVITGDGALAT